MSADSEKKRYLEIKPERYEIRIQGVLDTRWSEWLECANMTHTAGETILFCKIQDQTALHGLLVKIRDMNLKLISFARVDFEPDEN